MLRKLVTNNSQEKQEMNKIQITSAGGEACHSHRSAELIYVLTGQAKIHIRGEDYFGVVEATHRKVKPFWQ